MLSPRPTGEETSGACARRTVRGLPGTHPKVMQRSPGRGACWRRRQQKVRGLPPPIASAPSPSPRPPSARSSARWYSRYGAAARLKMGRGLPGSYPRVWQRSPERAAHQTVGAPYSSNEPCLGRIQSVHYPSKPCTPCARCPSPSGSSSPASSPASLTSHGSQRTPSSSPPSPPGAAPGGSPPCEVAGRRPAASAHDASTPTPRHVPAPGIPTTVLPPPPNPNVPRPPAKKIRPNCLWPAGPLWGPAGQRQFPPSPPARFRRRAPAPSPVRSQPPARRAARASPHRPSKTSPTRSAPRPVRRRAWLGASQTQPENTPPRLKSFF